MTAIKPSAVAFEIVTVPDIAGIRCIYDLDVALSDGDVAEYAFQRQRASSGGDNLPPHLQRVVEISLAEWGDAGLTVSSLSAADRDEGLLIERFVARLAARDGEVACWGAMRRQIPILRLRALTHAAQVCVKRSSAQQDALELLGRVADLSGQLQGASPDLDVPVDQLIRLLGAAPARALDDAAVWSAWQGGDLKSVTAECERRAFATLHVLLRARCVAGVIDGAQCAAAERAIAARRA